LHNLEGYFIQLNKINYFHRKYLKTSRMNWFYLMNSIYMEHNILIIHINYFKIILE